MNYIVSLIVVLLFSLLTWPINGEVIGYGDLMNKLVK